MVGLRILLEAANHHKNNTNNKGGVGQQPHVLCKTMSLKSTLPSPLSYPSSPLPPITFLDACYLCRKRLLPEKDIYMYKGDRAFCSVECRYRQILMDEESVKREKCSLAAMKPTTITTITTTTSSSSSSSTRYQHNNNKPTTTINSKNIKKNRLGGFAY